MSQSPDFDHLSLTELRRRRGEKWSTYAADVLPAWVAEMDFPVAGPIRDLLQESISGADFGYPRDAQDEGIPQAFADRMAERFGWSVDPDRVELLSDVVQGMYLAVQTLSRPGSGVLIQTPIYPPFLLAAAENDRPIVENRLLHTDAGYEIDFDALKRDLVARPEVFFLCNPHNPSGKALERRELETLGALACEHQWVVLSDEIHADLVYRGKEHIPFASISPEVAARTVTLTSATKAFNIPGLRLAVAHFGSEEMQRRFNQIPAHARGGLGLFGIHATLAAWKSSDPWLDQARTYLEESRRRLGILLQERIPEIVYRSPDATYLAWLDCAALDLPQTPASHFLEHGRVALSPGPNFGTGYETFARLNFATSHDLLAEIVERMATALGR